MNIFYVHPDPETSAKMLCNQHVCKMSLESAQMLANCFPADVLALPGTPKTQKGTPRKYSHWNHPSSIWVRQSTGNMLWLIDHAVALCHEKKHRYPDKPMPFVYEFLNWCKNNINLCSTPAGDLTGPPPQCMPDQYKDPDTITAYKKYYNGEKLGFAKWSKRNVPNWVDKDICTVV